MCGTLCVRSFLGVVEYDIKSSFVGLTLSKYLLTNLCPNGKLEQERKKGKYEKRRE